MFMKDKARQDTATRKGSKAAHHAHDDDRTKRHGSSSKTITQSQDLKDPQRSKHHRSLTIRPHSEREKVGDHHHHHKQDAYAYYQSRSSLGHHAVSNKAMSPEEAQKAIHTLLKQVKETTAFFAAFKDAYQHDVRSIEAYAGQSTLQKLWERKIKYNKSKNNNDDDDDSGRGDRLSKSRSKNNNNDGVGSRSAFEEVSMRLQDRLNDAYNGAKSHPTAQNTSLARKLDAAIKEIGRLLDMVQFYFQEMDSLIRELKLLKVVLELGGAGTAINDNRAGQRERHIRESSADAEDARCGDLGGESDSEDDGQPDEKENDHLERSDGRESEAGGDEEGQGL